LENLDTALGLIIPIADREDILQFEYDRQAGYLVKGARISDDFYSQEKIQKFDKIVNQ
jgi:hypothetical protein